MVELQLSELASWYLSWLLVNDDSRTLLPGSKQQVVSWRVPGSGLRIMDEVGHRDQLGWIGGRDNTNELS